MIDKSKKIKKSPSWLRRLWARVTFEPRGWDHTIDLNDRELTKFCMRASESSLREVWDSKEDKKWNDIA
jgi:hypothetical protein